MLRYKRYPSYQKSNINSITTTKQRYHVPQNLLPVDASTISNWLVAYSGTFTYLLDMQKELAKNGLTDAQWNGVVKCYNNDINRKSNSTTIAKDIRLATPVPVVINRSAALAIKKNMNLMFAPFTLEVVAIRPNTFRGFKAQSIYNSNVPYVNTLDLVVRINGSNAVNVCRICSKSLTDHKSMVSGIGPVCAKSLGVSYHTYQSDIKKFMQQFADECNKVGEFSITWKPYHIKDGKDELFKELISIHSQFTGNNIIASPSIVAPTVLTPISTGNGTTVSIPCLMYDPDTKAIRVKSNMDMIKFHITMDKFFELLPNMKGRFPDSFKMKNIKTNNEVIFKQLRVNTYIAANESKEFYLYIET